MDTAVKLEDENSEKELSEFLAGGLGRRLGFTPALLRIARRRAGWKIETGKIDDALKLYSAVALMDPSDTNHLADLARCALIAGLPDLALKTASSIVVLEPANPLGYYYSGAACMALGKPAEAAEDLRDAIRYAKSAGNAEVAELAGSMLAKVVH